MSGKNSGQRCTKLLAKYETKTDTSLLCTKQGQALKAPKRVARGEQLGLEKSQVAVF